MVNFADLHFTLFFSLGVLAQVLLTSGTEGKSFNTVTSCSANAVVKEQAGFFPSPTSTPAPLAEFLLQNLGFCSNKLPVMSEKRSTA